MMACRRLLFLVGVAAGAAATQRISTAKVSFGDLHGNALEGVDEYLGIPYAESPVGNKRFMAPNDWTQPYGKAGQAANGWGARCMQEAVDEAPIPYDENCLFMNIWSPRGSHDTLLPVMFFIHGGEFLFGAGDMYNSTELTVATGNVVVNANYRLGVFGFAQLGVGQDGANVGLLDQQSALRWFVREASAFRGDAGKVLLFGESAGAMSVGLHLVIPSSKDLFQRVLAESGSAVAMSKAHLRKSGDHLSELLNCSSLSTRLACLQNVSAKELLSIAMQMVTPLPGQASADVPWSFFASVDGVTIREDPLKLLQAGKFNKVAAVVVGYNHDEAFSTCCTDPMTGQPVNVNTTYFSTMATKILNAHGQTSRPGDTEKLVRAYGAQSVKGDLSKALGDMEGDNIFICRTRAMLRALARSGTVVHKYVFNQRAKYDPSPASYGVYHSSELAFVFGTNESGSLRLLPSMTTGERCLKSAMQDLWGSFASGRQSTQNGQAWPEYNVSIDNHLLLQGCFEKLPEGEGFHKLNCDVWDDIWESRSRFPAVLI